MPVTAVMAIARRADRAYFSSFGSSGFKASVLRAINGTIFPQEVENSKPVPTYADSARERGISPPALILGLGGKSTQYEGAGTGVEKVHGGPR